MQPGRNESHGEGFGTLLGRGFKLYGRTLGASFPAYLLCSALPAMLGVAAIYYALVALMQPLFACIQAFFEALITYGFDERAIEQAMWPAIDALESYSLPDAERVLGWIIGAVLLVVPLGMGSAVFLLPLGNGAVAEAQSRAWHGVTLPFSRAFGAVKGRYGKLIVLGLVNLLSGFVLNLLFYGATSLLSIHPLVGMVAAPVAMGLNLAAEAAVEGILCLAYLVAVNEDKWHFDALFAAVKRFFTHGAYVGTAMVYVLILGFSSFLVCFLDLFLAVVLLFPPVMTILLSALAMPLNMAMMTSVYYAQRKKEGYAPACRVP